MALCGAIYGATCLFTKGKATEVQLRDEIRILRKSWVVIVALTLTGVVAGATYAALQAPVYSTSAKLFVSASTGSGVADLSRGSSFTQARVETYTALAITPIVLLPVILELRSNLSSDQLAAMTTVTTAVGSNIIEVAVTDTDPARAALLATKISESLATVAASVEISAGTANISPVTLALIQRPPIPQTPISPVVPLFLGIGAFEGFALGVAFSVLRNTLDTRIRSMRDVEAITDAPILGGIAFDPQANTRPLIVHADPRSPRAESFRSLRTNLQFLDIGRTDRCFVITSAIQTEGKSTTAANLAIALADAHSRVLIVDADLRRPRLATYLGIEGAMGLTDLLIGKAEPDDVIQPWGNKSLFVLPAGANPPNPSELLGSEAMIKLIEEFNSQFDVVIFDSPPLLPVTDAAILARVAGGTLVVCAAGRTQKNQLRSALSALKAVDAPISGLVLTMLPTKGPNASGYGRYGYGYGYEETVAAP